MLDSTFFFQTSRQSRTGTRLQRRRSFFFHQGSTRNSRVQHRQERLQGLPHPALAVLAIERLVPPFLPACAAVSGDGGLVVAAHDAERGLVAEDLAGRRGGEPERVRGALRVEIAALLREVDVLALPATACAAPPVTDSEAREGFVDPEALDRAGRAGDGRNIAARGLQHALDRHHQPNMRSGCLAHS